MAHKLTTTVARSVGEIEAFRDVWQAWQTHPDNDIDNFLLLLKSRKEILRPHVVLFSRGDQPVTLVVCRLERARVNFAIGYKSIRGPVVNSLTVPYGGILGQCDDESASLVLDTLSQQVRKERVDRIAFHYLPEGSPLLNQLCQANGKSTRIVYDEWSSHWKSNLSPDVDAFWAKLSRKHRMFLRRVTKNLERDYAGNIVYSCVSDEAGAGQLSVQMEEIARKTYLRGLGRGFSADAEHLARLTTSAKNGRLRGFLLQIVGKPVSYAVGSVYSGKYSLAYTAYDPEFSGYDVGQLIVMHAIESLSREGVQQFDFGFGTALYKERFGDVKVRERSAYLYAPTARAMSLSTALKVSAGITSAARACLNKLGVVNSLKRYWRKRLAQAHQARPTGEANASDKND